MFGMLSWFKNRQTPTVGNHPAAMASDEEPDSVSSSDSDMNEEQRHEHDDRAASEDEVEQFTEDEESQSAFSSEDYDDYLPVADQHAVDEQESSSHEADLPADASPSSGVNDPTEMNMIASIGAIPLDTPAAPEITIDQERLADFEISKGRREDGQTGKFLLPDPRVISGGAWIDETMRSIEGDLMRLDQRSETYIEDLLAWRNFWRHTSFFRDNEPRYKRLSEVKDWNAVEEYVAEKKECKRMGVPFDDSEMEIPVGRSMIDFIAQASVQYEPPREIKRRKIIQAVPLAPKKYKLKITLPTCLPDQPSDSAELAANKAPKPSVFVVDDAGGEETSGKRITRSTKAGLPSNSRPKESAPFAAPLPSDLKKRAASPGSVHEDSDESFNDTEEDDTDEATKTPVRKKRTLLPSSKPQPVAGSPAGTSGQKPRGPRAPLRKSKPVNRKRCHRCLGMKKGCDLGQTQPGPCTRCLKAHGSDAAQMCTEDVEYRARREADRNYASRQAAAVQTPPAPQDSPVDSEVGLLARPSATSSTGHAEPEDAPGAADAVMTPENQEGGCGVDEDGDAALTDF